MYLYKLLRRVKKVSISTSRAIKQADIFIHHGILISILYLVSVIPQFFTKFVLTHQVNDYQDPKGKAMPFDNISLISLIMC